MSYRATLDCVGSHMDIDTDSSGKVWFTLNRCHNCEDFAMCREVASEYATIRNKWNRIRGVATIGDRLISVARSIGH